MDNENMNNFGEQKIPEEYEKLILKLTAKFKKSVPKSEKDREELVLGFKNYLCMAVETYRESDSKFINKDVASIKSCLINIADGYIKQLKMSIGMKTLAIFTSVILGCFLLCIMSAYSFNEFLVCMLSIIVPILLYNVFKSLYFRFNGAFNHRLVSVKSVFLKDDAFEELKRKSMELFKKAQSIMRRESMNIEIDKEAEIEAMEVLAQNVKKYNEAVARNLLSEGVLDLEYISNPNRDVFSLRLYQFKKEVKEICLLLGILEVKYIKAMGREVNIDPRVNADIFPCGWYSNGDLVRKAHILKEAIEKKCLITDTKGYLEIEEGVRS